MQDADSQSPLEDLQQQLIQAQQNIERLEAEASLTASITNVAAEDGSKSVAEQVTEQVGAIRTELEARHNARVQQAETLFQNRTDTMRGQLSKKLQEGKEHYKTALEAEHKAALEKLRTEHQEEIGQLNARHREELEVLRQNEESRFKQFRETWIAEHPTARDPVEGEAKTEGQIPQQTRTLSESQIKDLIANDPTVKGIVSRNIRTKVDQERENLTRKIKEEQEKTMADQLTEVLENANKARENAVQMEGKKYNVKLSMAENRSRAAIAKIEVVQKAAEETPQRPVCEVWAIAQNARPAPVVAARPPSATGVQPSVNAQPSTFGRPTPLSTSVRPQQTAPAGTSLQSSLSSPLPVLPSQVGTQQPTSGEVSAVPVSKAHSVQTPSTNTVIPATLQPGSKPPQRVLSSPTQQALQPRQPPNLQQPNPGLPAKPPQTQQSQHPGADVILGAPRGQTSAIPRGGLQALRGARGGRGGQLSNSGNQSSQGLQTQVQERAQIPSNIGRGTGIPRGAARGRGTQGRGGLPQVHTNTSSEGQNRAQTSPGSARGALNAGARQFVPQGNKRVREEGQEGSEVNGKRVKNESSGN